jgi:hypothetical protein
MFTMTRTIGYVLPGHASNMIINAGERAFLSIEHHIRIVAQFGGQPNDLCFTFA